MQGRPSGKFPSNLTWESISRSFSSLSSSLNFDPGNLEIASEQRAQNSNVSSPGRAAYLALYSPILPRQREINHEHFRSGLSWPLLILPSD